jgi:hypothetical protein
MFNFTTNCHIVFKGSIPLRCYRNAWEFQLLCILTTICYYQILNFLPFYWVHGPWFLICKWRQELYFHSVLDKMSQYGLCKALNMVPGVQGGFAKCEQLYLLFCPSLTFLHVMDIVHSTS